MTTYPGTVQGIVRFGGGAIFANSLVLGDTSEGILGTNVLGDYNYTNIPKIQRMSIRRGRSSLDDDFGAGTATIEFLDETGAWNPENASGPYYGDLVPGVQLQCRVINNGTATDLFAGYIRSYDHSFRVGEPYARVTITAEDALYSFNLAQISTVTGTSAGQLPGTRIGLLLDELDWPNAARELDAGTVTLQNDPGDDRSLLDAIRTVEQSDLGMFFIDTSGNATFYSRQTVANKAVGTPVEFRDDGTDNPYIAVDYDYSDEEIVNSCTVTRLGGTGQTATDSTSITRYFQRQKTFNDLLMQTDARALQHAQAVVAYRKTPRLRVQAVEFLVIDAGTYAAAVNTDFADRLVVEKDYVGTTLELSATVQGIDHEITPDRWTCTMSTAEALTYSFVLGSAQFGILGVNTL